MKVLITGDSHTGTLKQGISVRDRTDEPAEAEIVIRAMGNGKHFRTPFFTDAGDHALIAEPEFKRQFARIPPANAKYDLIGLSAPFHTVRVWRQNWDGFSPWPISSGNNSEKLVSANVLKQIIRDDVKYLLDFLDIIARSTRIFVIESPWPFRHHKAVRENGAEKVAYIHKAYRDFVMNELRARNIPVVEIDPSWVDGQGFMDARFKSEKKEDQHHGNSEFGRLMMSRIERFIDNQALIAMHSL